MVYNVMGIKAELSTPSSLKRFFFNKTKYTDVGFRAFVKEASDVLNHWHMNTEDLLSDELPEEYKYTIKSGPNKGKVDFKHTVRPDNEYPHINFGELKNSIYTGIDTKTINKSNFSFAAVMQITAPQGVLTNAGLPRRAKGDTPSWVGWQDEIFEGQADFISVDKIFSVLQEARDGLGYLGYQG